MCIDFCGRCSELAPVPAAQPLRFTAAPPRRRRRANTQHGASVTRRTAPPVRRRQPLWLRSRKTISRASQSQQQICPPFVRTEPSTCVASFSAWCSALVTALCCDFSSRCQRCLDLFPVVSVGILFNSSLLFQYSHMTRRQYRMASISMSICLCLLSNRKHRFFFTELRSIILSHR